MIFWTRNQIKSNQNSSSAPRLPPSGLLPLWVGALPHPAGAAFQMLRVVPLWEDPQLPRVTRLQPKLLSTLLFRQELGRQVCNLQVDALSWLWAKMDKQINL